MFLVNLEEGRIIGDVELKQKLASRHPYGKWLGENRLTLDQLPEPVALNGSTGQPLKLLQRAFGYTVEELRILTTPMAVNGSEAIGSMGNDAPLAVLSDQNHLLYNYFKQLFAQVTNPPLDAIREELVTSTESFIGCEQNLFQETPAHCRQLSLKSPIINNVELEKIRSLDSGDLRSVTLSTLFDTEEGPGEMRAALNRLCGEATRAIKDGKAIIILSDRNVDSRFAPIPALLATSAVHHHLIREGARTAVGLVVESGEPREVHHLCLLIGYGAGAVNPYLALATVADMAESGELNGASPEYAGVNFIKANEKGLVKVMSKMGISTVQSYRGAQIFEAVGLNKGVIDQYFTWTPSRIEGIGVGEIEEESRQRHTAAFTPNQPAAERELEMGGM